MTNAYTEAAQRLADAGLPNTAILLSQAYMTDMYEKGSWLSAGHGFEEITAQMKESFHIQPTKPGEEHNPPGDQKVYFRLGGWKQSKDGTFNQISTTEYLVLLSRCIPEFDVGVRLALNIFSARLLALHEDTMFSDEHTYNN